MYDSGTVIWMGIFIPWSQCMSLLLKREWLLNTRIYLPSRFQCINYRVWLPGKSLIFCDWRLAYRLNSRTALRRTDESTMKVVSIPDSYSYHQQRIESGSPMPDILLYRLKLYGVGETWPHVECIPMKGTHFMYNLFRIWHSSWYSNVKFSRTYMWPIE